jgi:hypothetical protein
LQYDAIEGRVVMDELVASAMSHWGPRFTVNGVTVADFARVTASIERWSDWCAAWVAVGSEHEALGRDAPAEGRTRSAGEHLSQAAAYHHFAKFVFVEEPDQMRAAHGLAVACLNDALPHLDPPGRRIEMPFEGSRLVGILRLPAGDGPHPVVVLLPCLDSTKEELRSTEDTFLARGLATLAVDGPGQGEADGRKDRLIPWQQAERLCATVGGPVELLMLEDGNTAAPTSRPGTGPALPTGSPPD